MLLLIAFSAAPVFASDASRYVTDSQGYYVGKGGFEDSTGADTACGGSEVIWAEDYVADGYVVQTDVWYWRHDGGWYQHVGQAQTSGSDYTDNDCVSIPEGAPVKLRVCKDNANIAPTGCKYAYPNA